MAVAGGAALPTARVIDIDECVWSAGAPAPTIVASEDRKLLAFEHPDGSARILDLVNCTAIKFGFPNDEALHGHPLAAAGLTPYALHEIEHSPWLDELRSMERVHERSTTLPFPAARHFVFTFHDATFEAVAQAVRVVGSESSVERATVLMAELVSLG